MERACKHGYHECQRCVDEADERARQVAKHYAKDLERITPRPGQNMYHHPDLAEGGPAGDLSGPYAAPVLAPRRCDCGSRLLAPEALQTGVCYYCRTGKQRPWTSRCECGSGLMGSESIDTGKCSNCRLDEEYGDDF